MSHLHEAAATVDAALDDLAAALEVFEASAAAGEMAERHKNGGEVHGSPLTNRVAKFKVAAGNYPVLVKYMDVPANAGKSMASRYE